MTCSRLLISKWSLVLTLGSKEQELFPPHVTWWPPFLYHCHSIWAPLGLWTFGPSCDFRRALVAWNRMEKMREELGGVRLGARHLKTVDKKESAEQLSCCTQGSAGTKKESSPSWVKGDPKRRKGRLPMQRKASLYSVTHYTPRDQRIQASVLVLHMGHRKRTCISLI